MPDDQPSWMLQAGHSIADYFRHPVNRWVVGPIVGTGAALISPLPARLPVALAGIAYQAMANYAQQRHTTALEERSVRKNAEDEIRRQLKRFITYTETNAKSPGRLRANVMMPDPQTNYSSLAIAYWEGPYGEDELELHWDKMQGTSGYTWALNDRHQWPSPTDADCDYDLVAKQVQRTAALKMTLSHPIRDPGNHNRVIGVVNLDDTEPPGEYTLGLRVALEQLAKDLAPLLQKTSLKFPT